LSVVFSPATSPIPASLKSSMQYCMFGLFAIGISYFGPMCVSGCRRVPYPPERTRPFIGSTFVTVLERVDIPI